MINKKRLIITIGVICFVLGLYFISYNYLKEKVDKAYSNINLQILSLNESVENLNNNNKFEIDNDNNNDSNNDVPLYEEIEENVDKNNEVNNKQENSQGYYIAKIKIPKINLEKGLVDINSKYNNVNKNIQIIKGSSFPTNEGSNLILASHNGSSSISYFRNLYKLSKGDKCYIVYKGKTYIYNIVNIYQQEKDGTIAIYRDYNKTSLTLVTCTKDSKTKQTIYIAELIQIKEGEVK